MRDGLNLYTDKPQYVSSVLSSMLSRYPTGIPVEYLTIAAETLPALKAQ